MRNILNVLNKNFIIYYIHLISMFLYIFLYYIIIKLLIFDYFSIKIYK